MVSVLVKGWRAAHNPEFKAKYEAMVKAGKSAKVAIVAIMRKLLIVANAAM